jgi:AbrB family looped-hinge helix DNA binding protein
MQHCIFEVPMQESTVTIKGQTTLPRDVRAALKLHPGDKVRYIILDGGEVRLVRCQPLSRLAGLLKGKADRHITVEDMNEAIATGATQE